MLCTLKSTFKTWLVTERLRGLKYKCLSCFWDCFHFSIIVIPLVIAVGFNTIFGLFSITCNFGLFSITCIFTIWHLCFSAVKVINHHSTGNKFLEMGRNVVVFHAVLICCLKTKLKTNNPPQYTMFVITVNSLSVSWIFIRFLISFSSTWSNSFMILEQKFWMSF